MGAITGLPENTVQENHDLDKNKNKTTYVYYRALLCCEFMYEGVL